MSHPDRVANRIITLMRERLYVEPPDVCMDLFATSMVDSGGVMRLLAMLEDEFQIEVTGEDLRLDHFRTVRRIAAFVVAKQAEMVGPRL